MYKIRRFRIVKDGVVVARRVIYSDAANYASEYAGQVEHWNGGSWQPMTGVQGRSRWDD